MAINSPVGSAFLEVQPKLDDGFQRRIASQVEPVGRHAGGVFAGAVSSAMGFLGAQVVGAGFRLIGQGVRSITSTVFDMNKTLETSTLQFETLMGDADRATKHVADLFEFAKKTPFETGPIIEASRMMQTFGGDALNTMDNLTLLGDASAATAAPIQELGFWVGRAYSNIQSGRPFGEAAMRLQELAVLSPQARTEMEELQKAGASTSEVWAVLERDLARFSGAMVKQASTWSGLTSTLSDVVKLNLAQAFQPLFEMAKAGAGGLIQFFESERGLNAIAAFQAGVERFAAFLTNLGKQSGNLWRAIFNPSDEGRLDDIATIIDNIFGNTGNLIKPLKAVGSVFQDIWTIIDKGVLPTFRELWDSTSTGASTLAALTSPFGILREGLGFLADNAERLAPILGPLVAGFLAFKTVGAVLTPLISGFSALSGIVGLISAPVLAIGAAIAALVAGVIYAWNNFEGFREAVLEIWTGIQTGVTAAIEAVKSVLSGVWTGIVSETTDSSSRIGSLMDNLVGIFKGVWDVVVIIFNSAREFWRVWGDEIIGLIGNAINTVAGIIEGIVRVIRGVVDIIAGIFTGDWRRIWEGLKNVVGGVWDGIKAIISGAVGQVMVFLGDFVRSAQDTIRTGLEKVVTFFKELPGKIMDFLKELPGQMVSFGQDLIEGILRGLGGLAGRLFDNLKNSIGNAIDNVKSFFGISSPSRYTARYIGAPLGQGLMKGFEDALNPKALLETTRRAVDAISGAALPAIGAATLASFDGGLTTATNSTNTLVSPTTLILALDPEGKERLAEYVIDWGARRIRQTTRAGG